MNRILIIFFPLWLVLLYSGCVTMEERSAIQAATGLQERFNARGMSR